jgi:hypothetical protein
MTEQQAWAIAQRGGIGALVVPLGKPSISSRQTLSTKRSGGWTILASSRCRVLETILASEPFLESDTAAASYSGRTYRQ